MKTIFSAHDITAMVAYLQDKKLDNARIINIYDITSSQIILKLQLEKEKYFLFLDSGKKFYLLPEFKAAKMPNSFAIKLRKHCNNKRITSIQQINYDRVLDITISDSTQTYHLILEMYASGNIIFTDADLKILYLVHHHTYQLDDISQVVKTGNIYPIKLATTSMEKYQVIADNIINSWKNYLTNPDIPAKKKKQKSKLKMLLSSTPLGVYGSILIESVLSKSGIDVKQKYTLEDALCINISQMEDWIQELQLLKFKTILGKKIYLTLDGDNFYPYLYDHLDESTLEKIDDYNEGLVKYFQSQDSHFWKSEKTKLKTSLQSSSINDKQSKENTKKQATIDKLKNQIQEYQSQIDILSQAIIDIQSHLPFTIVKKVFPKKVGKDQIAYELRTYSTTDEIKYLPDISEGKNISMLNQEIKSLKHKIEKCEQVLSKQTENKIKEEKREIKKEIKNKIKKEDILPPVKWYHQYHWFFTSNNNLVVCGRNSQQNESLVKKYLSKNDIYFHSSVAGSGSAVLKLEGQEVSPKELEEAGAWVITHSRAWQSNISDKSYWVYPDQVSKTAPTGEYVTAGSFIIRGKRNFLIAPRLELGLGLSIMKKENKIKHIQLITAPMNIIKKMDYHVKITPGKQKIGKSSQAIKEYWTSKSKDDTLIGMIKLLPMEEFQRVIPTGFQITFPEKRLRSKKKK